MSEKPAKKRIVVIVDELNTKGKVGELTNTYTFSSRVKAYAFLEKQGTIYAGLFTISRKITSYRTFWKVIRHGSAVLIGTIVLGEQRRSWRVQISEIQ